MMLRMMRVVAYAEQPQEVANKGLVYFDNWSMPERGYEFRGWRMFAHCMSQQLAGKLAKWPEDSANSTLSASGSASGSA